MQLNLGTQTELSGEMVTQRRKRPVREGRSVQKELPEDLT